MAKRRVWKRLLLVLGGLFLALIAIVLTSPFWVPPLMQRGAERFGVTYDKYERTEDGRFVIEGLVRTNEAFDLQISRIEGFRPTAWYRQIRRHDTNDPPTFLEVNGWKVVVHPPSGKDEQEEPKPELGVYDYFQLAEEYTALARRWVPKALFLNGVVEYEDRHVTIATITWENGELEGAGTWPEEAIPLDIKARLTEEPPFQLSFAMHSLDFRTRLRVFETNRTIRASLATFYKESRADLEARFATNGLIPVEASLSSQDFSLPAELVKLEQYRNLTGDLSARWEDNEYTLNLEAHAEPLGSSTNFPPVDLLLAVAGDTNSVRVETLQATAPGLSLTNSAPVELSYQGKLLSGSSQLFIAAVLEQLPWVDLKGTVNGTLVLEPGDQLPLVNFTATGTNVGLEQLMASTVDLQGRVEWPVVEELRGALQFGSNGVVRFSASGNASTREIEAAQVEVSGAIAQELLPSGVTYDSVELRAQASGPVTNLQHEAKLQLRGFDAPQINRLNLDLEWHARQADFDRLAFLVRAGPATLFLAGAGEVDERSTNLTVRELRLSQGEEIRLELAEPFRISLLGTNIEGIAKPLVRLAGLHWVGENRALHAGGQIAWPTVGDLSFAVTNIPPALFQPFLERSLSGLEVAHLRMEADWNQGPLHASVSGDLSAVQGPLDQLSAHLNVELDGSGLTLTDLAVTGTNSTILTARGFLPISVHPLDSLKPVQLSSDERFDFHLKTAPNERFWNKIGSLAKIQLENPAVSLDVTGTTRKPSGKLEFSFAAVDLLETNRPLPELRNLEGSVLLNEEVLRVPSIALDVEGEPLMLSAETPLGAKFWSLRREEIQGYLMTNSMARLRARDLNVAPFVRFAPEYLSPEGTVNIDAGINPGLSLSGFLLATNINTRPLPSVGVVEDISVRLELEGRKVRLQELSAMLGGETVVLRGTIDLAEEQLARAYPGIDISIQGTNLPLARNPDVILRSDLDLKISNATTNPPVISGDVNLHDSVLLQDIATLVPGGVASPSKRPPYFSLEQDPVDDWKLDLRVRGIEFMRVRSPFFQGQVSANFRVVGTLQEPTALGEATIDTGRIIFPFATLGVQQAIVSLTSENPYLPHVFAIAKGRAFGYDITMQAEGPADEPVIEFSSVPPLTSEEIVLMLTTGQIPRSDFGFSSQERASRLALFLGKSFWQKLNPGAADEERLTIRSGEDVSEEGKQTYAVEYKLTDDWSLVGEYDRFGDLNAGVKWKVFSR